MTTIYLERQIKISGMLLLLVSLPFLLKAQKYSGEKNKKGGELLLKSGFEDGVSVTPDMIRLQGSDIGGVAWENRPSWIESCRFVYIVGPDARLSDFMASTIEEQIGPEGKQSRVLRMMNKADDENHHATSRNEFSLFSKKPPHDYKEGYVRYWMKLQANLKSLVPLEEGSPWYMIMEWKEPNSHERKSTEECKECCDGSAGGTNNYRINIGIEKKANASDFHWVFRAEHPQPCRKKLWGYESDEIDVPLGEWFLVEAYMKRHPTDGRVYFAVNHQVVLDTDITRPEGFTGGTEHPDNPLPLAFWSPMKNYHSMSWNRRGPVSQWYDDFELWSTFPPDHPEWKK